MILEQIRAAGQEILQQYYAEQIDESDLVQLLRDQAGSKELFKVFLEELFLSSIKEGKIPVSKYLLKLYLKEAPSSYEDAFVIGEDQFALPQTVISEESNVHVAPGIFLSVVWQLNLTRTIDVRIKQLLALPQYMEIHSQVKVEGTCGVEEVIETLYQEFDEKVPASLRFVQIDIEGLQEGLNR